MQLEDQVCSLELAKRLKELLVKQDSVFSWAKHEENYELTSTAMTLLMTKRPKNVRRYENENVYSAFTLYEIFSLLPFRFTKDEKINMVCRGKDGVQAHRDLRIEHDYHLKLSKIDLIPTEWYCWAIGHGYDEYGVNISEISFCEHSVNAANACAKMLIYLIENKLIEIPA